MVLSRDEPLVHTIRFRWRVRCFGFGREHLHAEQSCGCSHVCLVCIPRRGPVRLVGREASAEADHASLNGHKSHSKNNRRATLKKNIATSIYIAAPTKLFGLIIPRRNRYVRSPTPKPADEHRPRENYPQIHVAQALLPLPPFPKVLHRRGARHHAKRQR